MVRVPLLKLFWTPGIMHLNASLCAKLAIATMQGCYEPTSCRLGLQQKLCILSWCLAICASRAAGAKQAAAPPPDARALFSCCMQGDACSYPATHGTELINRQCALKKPL